MSADRAGLAHVDEGVLHAAGAQQFDDAVGDVSLTDAVQSDAHSRPSEPEPLRVDLQSFVANPRDGFGDSVGRRAVRGGVGPGEMVGVEIPKRLHRHVESASAQRAVAASFGENAHKVERWVLELPVAVEATKSAVRPVKTHDCFQTPHLREARLDQPIGGRRVGVMNLQSRVAAERSPCPYAQ